jgi:hypothetical protein
LWVVEMDRAHWVWMDMVGIDGGDWCELCSHNMCKPDVFECNVKPTLVKYMYMFCNCPFNMFMVFRRPLVTVAPR